LYTLASYNNYAISNVYIRNDRDIKDIKQLQQLERKDIHSKSHRILLNCGISYINNYYIVYIVLFIDSDG